MRTEPESFIPVLNDELSRIEGKLLMPEEEEGTILSLWEGSSAWIGAVSTLEDTLPRAALRWSDGLAAAAREHCEDMGNNGQVGHIGSDDSEFWQRAARYGNVIESSAENISYSATTGREAALALFVDDGVEGCQHRMNMIDEEYTVVGVANCKHSLEAYGSMTVVIYAGDFEITDEGTEKVEEYKKSLDDAETGGRRLAEIDEKHILSKEKFLG